MFQNTVDIWDSQKTFEKMTLFRDPSPLWLLQAEQPIGRVGFAATGDRRLRQTLFETHQTKLIIPNSEGKGTKGHGSVIVLGKVMKPLDRLSSVLTIWVFYCCCSR